MVTPGGPMLRSELGDPGHQRWTGASARVQEQSGRRGVFHQRTRSDPREERMFAIDQQRDHTVAKVYALPNAEASPTFYVVDPKAQLQAMTEMDDLGMELVGIFHSHTFTEAYPSRTDIELAGYPDATYLILSLADLNAPNLRGFSIRDGQVSEVEVRVAPSPDPVGG